MIEQQLKNAFKNSISAQEKNGLKLLKAECQMIVSALDAALATVNNAPTMTNKEWEDIHYTVYSEVTAMLIESQRKFRDGNFVRDYTDSYSYAEEESYDYNTRCPNFEVFTKEFLKSLLGHYQTNVRIVDSLT